MREQTQIAARKKVIRMQAIVEKFSPTVAQWREHGKLAEELAWLVPTLLDELSTLRAEQTRLREALKLADEGIQRGQACRNEGEFTRWMREVQAYRPKAVDVAALSSTPTPETTP